MADENGLLVARRPRRSTAGNRRVTWWLRCNVYSTHNRMEAALAEFKSEELGQDVEEDNDFVMEVGES